MTTQMTLFASKQAVREAKAQALKQVDERANDEWKAAAHRLLEQIARVQQFVAADDVWGALRDEGIETHNPSALGAIFSSAARRGLISWTGEVVTSNRLCRHGGISKLWRSRIYRGAA